MLGDKKELKAETAADDVRLVEGDADDEPEKCGLHVGAHVDEFLIEELLGRGGASEVYRAIDTRTNSSVALKFLLPSRLNDKQSCSRLRNEAKHIMGLKHRNIVSVVDVREHEAAGPYLVMELLDGKPLTAYVPLSPKESFEYCEQIAQALAYAHSKGMIHRDIKPSNVMILSDNSVRLVDFGLAKVFAPENPSHMPLTQTTEWIGTPLYMSPEQCFGQTVDARSDVYQLGCLLFQCLTGHPPFEGNNSFEAMYKHVSAPPKLDTMPEPIRDILTKALDKNPDARYQTASEMRQSLLDAIQGRHKPQKPPAKVRPTASLVAVALSLMIVPVMMVLIAMRAPSASDLSVADAPTIVHARAFTAAEIEAQRLFDEGVDYKAKGWTEKARESLTKAMQLDSSAIGFKALMYLRSRLPAHFQTPEAEQLNISGYNLSYSGQQPEAEQVWKDCIKRYPNFEWPYSNLAGQYMEAGHPEKALPLLEKAVDINPYYTNALRNLSDTELALGHRDLAIEYMRRAAASAPEQRSLRTSLLKLTGR